MGNKHTVVSGVLAVLAGVCFVTGVPLLTDERGVAKHGARKKINLSN